jgi:hypothetical protein
LLVAYAVVLTMHGHTIIKNHHIPFTLSDEAICHTAARSMLAISSGL